MELKILKRGDLILKRYGPNDPMLTFNVDFQTSYI